jgi:hypothetical protein
MKGAVQALLNRSRGRREDGEEGQGVEERKELEKMAARDLRNGNGSGSVWDAQECELTTEVVRIAVGNLVSW